MAKLDRNIFEEMLKLLLRDYNLKHRGDVTYLSKKPDSNQMSMKQGAVDNRGKFSVNGQFAGLLSKNKYLFQAWEKSKVKAGCPHNRIIKTNREFCLPDRPSKENVISPPGGFPLTLVDIEYKQENVRVKIKPIEVTKNEKKIICLLYICHYEPTLSDLNYFTLSEVKEGLVYKSEDKSETIFDLNKRDIQFANFYNKRIIYLCAATLNAKLDVVRCSETISVILDEVIIYG